jgi:carbonic anhydrase
VPATQIVDLPPGEIFVHRNVANVVVHTDLNALSTIQFAVDVLKVKHILVVGHYGCGGVGAVLKESRLGLIDNWLRHITDIALKHADKLDPSQSFAMRHAHLCELNALEQALNVCHTTVVREAWERGQQLAVHAWIYGLDNGHIHDLGLDVRGREQLPAAYQEAVVQLTRRWQGAA